MERIIVFILGVFLIAIVFTSLKAPASLIPIHSSSIKVEIQSDKLDQALQLLDKHPKYKKYVEDRISVIREGKLTRVWARDQPATFDITHKFINFKSGNVAYLASVLVHEARHVEQRHPLVRMNSQEQELDANAYQAIALTEMNGDRHQIESLWNADGLHFDTNGNGIMDIEDNWGY